ncbi:MAG: glycosyltransferase family 2 protein [Armatimonadota bacterium]
MTLSIIVPFLNEAEILPALLERISNLAKRLSPLNVELVLVDDGSTDGSAQIVRSATHPELSIRLVRLSRNFGSHGAFAAGISHSTGDVLTFLSADLQDPPELILDLVAEWRAGAEIVWATRQSRDDPWTTKIFSAVYYQMMRRFALRDMPLGGVDFCLVDRKVVAALDGLQERNSNIFNLIMWAGFRQTVIPYERVGRVAGTSKWSFSRKVKLFIDSFIAFSFAPIRLISLIGVVLSGAGLLYAAFIFVRQLMFGIAVSGWSSLMCVVLICSGVQLLMQAVMSEYLWRALDASRNRPPYIVASAETILGDSFDGEWARREAPPEEGAAGNRRQAAGVAEPRL